MNFLYAPDYALKVVQELGGIMVRFHKICSTGRQCHACCIVQVWYHTVVDPDTQWYDGAVVATTSGLLVL